VAVVAEEMMVAETMAGLLAVLAQATLTQEHQGKVMAVVYPILLEVQVEVAVQGLLVLLPLMVVVQ
jgi:hypothetical protein